MRAWRFALVGAALAAVSIIAMSSVSTASNVDPGSGEEAVAVPATPDLNGPDPGTPPESAFERAYGWGPFRVIDW